MNEILLFIYLADLSDKTSALLAVSSILIFVFAFFIFTLPDIGDVGQAKKMLERGIKLLIPVAVFAFIYPSKNTLYVAASAKAGQIGIEKLQGSDTLEKAIKLLNKKLDEALAEEKK